MFQRQWLGASTRSSLLALAPDGRGGVFVLKGDPVGTNGSEPLVDNRVLRFGGDGVPAVDWPGEVTLSSSGIPIYWDSGSSGSYRAYPDGLDGVLCGVPAYAVHGPPGFQVERRNGAGQSGGSAFIGMMAGHEEVVRQGGGMFTAEFSPHGPTGLYQPPAYIRLDQWPTPPQWSGIYEQHPETSLWWYGDVGLAPAGERAVVFFWSQERERFGLFARRFSEAGEVTAVGTSPPGAGLRLRFVRGEGVRVAAELRGVHEPRLDVFDAGGRRRATLRLPGVEGSFEATIPGTAGLSAGLYLVRLVEGPDRVGAKLIVTR
jgi:hypothetical protein